MTGGGGTIGGFEGEKGDKKGWEVGGQNLLRGGCIRMDWERGRHDKEWARF